VFTGLYTSQKEYPCCHGQHTAIEATLDLIQEHSIKWADVTEVTLHVSPGDYYYLAYPVEKKQNPENIIETQFSLYWGVASAIVYGKVDIGNFTAEALQDTRVREMSRRISARPETELVIGQGFTPAIVDIKTKDGKVYSRQVDYPFGSPENPMSLADMEEKFKHCCQYSIRPIPGKNQDEIIQMIREIEEVRDVSRIVSLLT
jgi:2-methylcitrate dehydratase PrpD